MKRKIEKTIDQRVLKTQKLLKTALSGLLKTKGYEDISVNDLTSEAGIGYRTFYRHYLNIDDFIISYIREELSEFQKHMIPGLDNESQVNNGVLLFEHVDQNREIFLLLFESKQADNLIQLLKERAVKASIPIMERFTDDKNLIDLITSHIVSSIISLIKWWIENDGVYTIEYMGRIYSELIINASKLSIINLKNP